MAPSISGRYVKSFSTFFVATSVAIACFLSLAGSTDAAKKQKRKAEDLTNFMLSPRYSRWLVGPISRLATEEEVGQYMAITLDSEAETFIAAFWKARGGGAVWPATNNQKIFDDRAAEADKFYTEGTIRGSITDRGTIYVLFGPPDQTRYEAHPKNRGNPIEVWYYIPETTEGLDGSKPDAIYLFRKDGAVTNFYRGPRRIGI